MTRGFINVMKWGSRVAKLDREVNRRRDKAIAVLFMLGSSIRSVLVKSAISNSRVLRLLDSYRRLPKGVNAGKSLQILPKRRLMGPHAAQEGQATPKGC